MTLVDIIKTTNKQGKATGIILKHQYKNPDDKKEGKKIKSEVVDIVIKLTKETGFENLYKIYTQKPEPFESFGIKGIYHILLIYVSESIRDKLWDRLNLHYHGCIRSQEKASGQYNMLLIPPP